MLGNISPHSVIKWVRTMSQKAGGEGDVYSSSIKPAHSNRHESSMTGDINY